MERIAGLNRKRFVHYASKLPNNNDGTFPLHTNLASEINQSYSRSQNAWDKVVCKTHHLITSKGTSIYTWPAVIGRELLGSLSLKAFVVLYTWKVTEVIVWRMNKKKFDREVSQQGTIVCFRKCYTTNSLFNTDLWARASPIDGSCMYDQEKQTLKMSVDFAVI